MRTGIGDLSDDVMIEIFSYIGAAGMSVAACVSRKWKVLASLSISDHERYLSAALGRTVGLCDSSSSPLICRELNPPCFKMDIGDGLCEAPIVSSDDCVCYIISPTRLGYFRGHEHTEVEVSVSVDTLVCAPSRCRPVTIGTCNLVGMLFDTAWFILTASGAEYVWTETEIGQSLWFGAAAEGDLLDIEVQTIISNIEAKSVTVFCNITRRDAGDHTEWYSVTLPVGDLSDVVAYPTRLDWVPHWHVTPRFTGTRVLLSRYSCENKSVEFRAGESAIDVVYTDSCEFAVDTTRRSIPTNLVFLPHQRFVVWCANRAVVVGRVAEGQLEVQLPSYAGSFIADIVYSSGILIIARNVRGIVESRLDAFYCCPRGSLVPFTTQMMPFRVASMTAIDSLLLVYTSYRTNPHIKCYNLHSNV